ncbi:MAG TPA: PIN domain nuclease [Arachnia sp.]|jgi:predicted nucleic acid-binding protein|nr:PIN domain nuclease [Propionibacteriaceae bacterium]HQD21877.1 PIN domain nuclease [Arachnia sp.]
MVDRWLVDKSAFVRLDRSEDAELWRERIDRGLVGVSTVTLLELGFSARSGQDWSAGLQGPPVSKLLLESMTPKMESRALAVQGMLAERGFHRAAKVPDLLIAAVAEMSGYTVLHVDRDFELIAEVTGQPIERLSMPS